MIFNCLFLKTKQDRIWIVVLFYSQQSIYFIYGYGYYSFIASPINIKLDLLDIAMLQVIGHIAA